MNNELYTCPCCGYKTLEQCPPGTFEVCLYEAQRNFMKYGASEEIFINSVRKPTTNDQRDSHFKLTELPVK